MTGSILTWTRDRDEIVTWVGHKSTFIIITFKYNNHPTVVNCRVYISSRAIYKCKFSVPYSKPHTSLVLSFYMIFELQKPYKYFFETDFSSLYT